MSKKHVVSEKVSALIANAYRLATAGLRFDDLKAECFGNGYVPLWEAYSSGRYSATRMFEMGIALIEVCCKAEMYGQAAYDADDVRKYIPKLPNHKQAEAAERLARAVANIPNYRVTIE